MMPETQAKKQNTKQNQSKITIVHSIVTECYENLF